MGLAGSRWDKPSCSHGGLLACYSLDGNIYFVTLSKFVFTVKGSLSLQGFGFKLVNQIGAILFDETEHSFKKDGFMFSVG